MKQLNTQSKNGSKRFKYESYLDHGGVYYYKEYEYIEYNITKIKGQLVIRFRLKYPNKKQLSAWIYNIDFSNAIHDPGQREVFQKFYNEQKNLIFIKNYSERAGITDMLVNNHFIDLVEKVDNDKVCVCKLKHELIL